MHSLTSLFAAASLAFTAMAEGAVLKLALANGGVRQFDQVTLHGATSQEGKGLVLHLSVGIDAPPHPVALDRILAIDNSTDDAITYKVLVSFGSGDFKKFDGVRLQKYEQGAFHAVPKGQEKAFPINASRVVYIEPEQKLAGPEKKDLWKAQISAQAFLVNNRGGKPWSDSSRRTIDQSQARYAATQVNLDQFPVRDPLGLIGKTLPQTRFLGPSGDVLDINELRDGRGMVLLIMRGFPGYVCPFCTAQTAAVLNRAEEFEKSGVRVALVFPGPADTVPIFLDAVREYRRSSELPVPILFDPELSATNSLGATGKLAKPTTVVLDRNGIIRYLYVGESFDDRPPVELIFTMARRFSEE